MFTCPATDATRAWPRRGARNGGTASSRPRGARERAIPWLGLPEPAVQKGPLRAELRRRRDGWRDRGGARRPEDVRRPGSSVRPRKPRVSDANLSAWLSADTGSGPSAHHSPLHHRLAVASRSRATSTRKPTALLCRCFRPDGTRGQRSRPGAWPGRPNAASADDARRPVLDFRVFWAANAASVTDARGLPCGVPFPSRLHPTSEPWPEPSLTPGP